MRATACHLAAKVFAGCWTSAASCCSTFSPSRLLKTRTPAEILTNSCCATTSAAFTSMKLPSKNCAAKFLEGSFIDVNAADVVAQQEFVRISAGVLVFNSLEGENVEQQLAALVQQPANTFAAR